MKADISIYPDMGSLSPEDALDSIGVMRLWNRGGWTQCWLQDGRPVPVNSRLTPPVIYKREIDARSVMTKLGRRGNSMIHHDLRERRLKIVRFECLRNDHREGLLNGDVSFVVARRPGC